MTDNKSSSDSVWYVAVQTECSHQAAQEWSLSERSEHIKQAAVDQQREQNWHQHSQKQKQQHKRHTKQGLYKLSAQWHILVWHLHDDCCCCCCCCWADHTRVSADIFNQKRFHIQKMSMKKLKKKEKEKLYVRWGVYNSLHWQINSSELLKEIFHLQTLLIQSKKTQVNRHWQLYNNLFRSLKHNLEEKERGDVISWTHTKVLWSSCLLRP